MHESAQYLFFSLFISENRDYVPLEGEVFVFESGSGVGHVECANVTIINDVDVEGPETFLVPLSPGNSSVELPIFTLFEVTIMEDPNDSEFVIHDITY